MKVDSLRDVESELNSLKLDLEREKLARTSNRNLFIGIATTLTAFLGYTTFFQIPTKVDDALASKTITEIERRVESIGEEAEQKLKEINSYAEQTASGLNNIENIENFQNQILTLSAQTSESTQPLKVRTGIAKEWELYRVDGEVDGYSIKIKVDTSDAGFQKTPHYFTSVAGKKNARLWKVTGTTGIYNPTKDGFELYLHRLDEGINPKSAKALGWEVHWLAIGE